MLTFGSGFGPGSERFCQVRAHPEPGTGPMVWFSPSPGPRTELRSGSVWFGFGPKFRTELRQPYVACLLGAMVKVVWVRDQGW